MISFDLTPEQETLRRGIIDVARAQLNADVATRDRDSTFDRSLWDACGALGLMGLPVPEALGGIGCDAVTTAVALEAFGYGCEDGGLVFSVCAHLLACVVPVWKFGTAEQHARWLRPLCDGARIAVNAMSEPGAGSDAFAMTTVAHPDGNGWRLRGTKTWASNGPVADVALVFALTDAAKGYHGGVTAFLVEMDTPGITASRSIEKMGLRTSPFGEITFDDVRVDADAVLGGVGGGATVFNTAMDWERALLGATHLGTMQRLLEQSVRHARTRRAFGQPIGRFQASGHKLVDMRVQLEAARLLTWRAARRLETDPRTVGPDAAMAKLAVSEALVQAALDAVQLHGGYGYCTEAGLERTLRDAVGSTIYSGTSEIQRTIIARWMGL